MDWQRRGVPYYRNIFSHVPNGRVADVARMLKAIHAQEDRRAAKTKATEIVERLKAMKLARLPTLAGGAEGPGDNDLRRLSVDPLAPDPNQQPTGKDHARDP